MANRQYRQPTAEEEAHLEQLRQEAIRVLVKNRGPEYWKDTRPYTDEEVRVRAAFFEERRRLGKDLERGDEEDEPPFMPFIPFLKNTPRKKPEQP